MRVIVARPPNFEAIDAAFNIRDKRVIFSWGDLIYNPMDVSIGQELFAHEAIHGAQQTHVESAIVQWWERYIADPDFRLAQETPAHVAEYRRYCQRQADRNKRIRFLFQVATRLSSDIYGNLVDQVKARHLILEAGR